MTEFEVSGAPHIPPVRTVGAIMREVLYALIPGVAAYVWFFGPGVLVQIILATCFALGFEAALLKVRGKPMRLYLTDGSAILTAVLFSLCIPPLTPWWGSLIAMFFAIVVAKHLYGGLGFNLFNPAMVGYAVLLIAFPLQMTQYLAPTGLADMDLSLLDTLSAIFTGGFPGSLTWDAVTQATPLDILQTEASQNLTVAEIRDRPIFGDFGGRGWEWIANLYALGGLWLLWRRIISWHIPVAMIGVVIALSLPFALADPSVNPPPMQHVFSGGLILGAFFIATDPVTASTTPRGRLIYAAGIGVLTLAIRRWGGYPDGVAFAVLLMNMAVPFIDAYTVPRIYGRAK